MTSLALLLVVVETVVHLVCVPMAWLARHLVDKHSMRFLQQWNQRAIVALHLHPAPQGYIQVFVAMLVGVALVGALTPRCMDTHRLVPLVLCMLVLQLFVLAHEWDVLMTASAFAPPEATKQAPPVRRPREPSEMPSPEPSQYWLSNT